MSMMQEATGAQGSGVPDAEDTGAAVEEQMGKIVTELGAALGVLLTSLGTRSGLWAALAGAGPLTTAEVAAKVSVDPALVREWLRAQAAAGTWTMIRSPGRSRCLMPSPPPSVTARAERSSMRAPP